MRNVYYGICGRSISCIYSTACNNSYCGGDSFIAVVLDFVYVLNLLIGRGM